jgi:membrane protein
MGAALAYYITLSLAPTVVIILAVAGLAFGAKAAQGRLVLQIHALVGRQGAEVIQSLIDGTHAPYSGIVASLLGLATLFLGGTAVVTELRDALNTIWQVADDVHATQVRNFFNVIKLRFQAFALVLVAGVVLVLSVILHAWISAAAIYLRLAGTAPPSLIHSFDWLVSFTLITLLFASIFKFLPAVRLQWRDVAAGSLVTSILFIAGKFFLGVYLTEAGFAENYGAAGSLVMLLVWVYYSAQVVFLGAEFTRVYALRFGSLVVSPRALLHASIENDILL